MQGIPELSKRFGISEKSVRRRLDILKPVLDQHLTTGRQNAILLTDSGIAIFDRLIQLEQQDKLSPTAALDKVTSEVHNGLSGASKHEEVTVQPLDQTVPPPTADLIHVLKQQVEDLRLERDRLLGIIEGQQSQMQLMLPGSKDGTDEEPRLSRWQHLRALVSGRR